MSTDSSHGHDGHHDHEEEQPMTYEEWREQMEAKGRTGFALSEEMYEFEVGGARG